MKPDTLVTGGSGLLGYALQSIFPEGLFVSSKNADLTQLSETRALFKKHQPRFVYHLAAKVGGVKTNAQKIADMFTVNTQINTNVLSVAQEFKVEKLVAVLSNCVFRENQTVPPVEKDVHIGMPFAGHRGYGYAKRMLDLQIELLRQQHGCNFTSITPVTMVGPNDNWNSDEGHVAGALIQKCHRAKKENKAFQIWGSGRAVRQFIYSVDVARILMEVMKKYNEAETIIVAADGGTSIKTLAETIARVMNFKGTVEFDSTKPEGELRRVLDNSKLLSLFPDFKFTSLEEMFKKTIPWFIDHAEKTKVIS